MSSTRVSSQSPTKRRGREVGISIGAASFDAGQSGGGLRNEDLSETTDIVSEGGKRQRERTCFGGSTVRKVVVCKVNNSLFSWGSKDKLEATAEHDGACEYPDDEMERARSDPLRQLSASSLDHLVTQCFRNICEVRLSDVFCRDRELARNMLSKEDFEQYYSKSNHDRSKQHVRKQVLTVRPDHVLKERDPLELLSSDVQSGDKRKTAAADCIPAKKKRWQELDFPQPLKFVPIPKVRDLQSRESRLHVDAQALRNTLKRLEDCQKQVLLLQKIVRESCKKDIGTALERHGALSMLSSINKPSLDRSKNFELPRGFRLVEMDLLRIALEKAQECQCMQKGGRLELNEVSPDTLQDDLACQLSLTCSLCSKATIFPNSNFSSTYPQNYTVNKSLLSDLGPRAYFQLAQFVQKPSEKKKVIERTPAQPAQFILGLDKTLSRTSVNHSPNEATASRVTIPRATLDTTKSAPTQVGVQYSPSTVSNRNITLSSHDQSSLATAIPHSIAMGGSIENSSIESSSENTNAIFIANPSEPDKQSVVKIPTSLRCLPNGSRVIWLPPGTRVTGRMMQATQKQTGLKPGVYRVEYLSSAWHLVVQRSDSTVPLMRVDPQPLQAQRSVIIPQHSLLLSDSARDKGGTQVVRIVNASSPSANSVGMTPATIDSSMERMQPGSSTFANGQVEENVDDPITLDNLDPQALLVGWQNHQNPCQISDDQGLDLVGKARIPILRTFTNKRKSGEREGGMDKDSSTN